MNESKIVLVEFLGSFIFFSIILAVVSDPSINVVAIPVGLLAAIYFGGKISGGHFNPAVSLMMYLKGKINAVLTLIYMMSQVIGAVAAVLLSNYLY